MANRKQKIDRWSASENAMLYVTQPKTNRTPTTELSVVSTMSTNNDPQNDQ